MGSSPVPIEKQIAGIESGLKEFIQRQGQKLVDGDRKAAEHGARLLAIEQALTAQGAGGASREICERAPTDAATGMPILSRKHRFADNLPAEMRSQEPLDMNVLWRGILCNRWPSRECPERKALGEASGSAGGYTLPLEISAQYIDFARANSVCIQSGAQTLPMTNATLRVPVLASDPVSTWKQENAPLTDTSITLDKRDATAKTLMSWLYMSVELAEDSPLISQIVSNAFCAFDEPAIGCRCIGGQCNLRAARAALQLGRS